jgi:hypothetical protein
MCTRGDLQFMGPRVDSIEAWSGYGGGPNGSTRSPFVLSQRFILSVIQGDRL